MVRMIDLGGEIYDGQRSHAPVSLTIFARYEDTAHFVDPPGRGFTTRLIQMCDHTATHVDSPIHFIPEGQSIDALPIEAFCGPAVCVDLTAPAAGTDACEVADVAQFEAACRRHGVEVRKDDILLLRLGEPAAGGCRGVGAALARRLVEIGVKSLGVDRPTPDDERDRTMPVHLTLLPAGITIVEGLHHLELVAGKRFFYVGTPLKLVGATGSPLRPVALLDLAEDGQ